MGCYERGGSPGIDNDRVRAAAKLIKQVYEHALSGGGLHVLLDDWNVDHDSFCERYTGHDADYTKEEIEVEESCAKAMRLLTVEERLSALCLAHYPEHFVAKPQTSESARVKINVLFVLAVLGILFESVVMVYAAKHGEYIGMTMAIACVVLLSIMAWVNRK